ncbi:hypothetical protein GOBAR_DD19773 [Gossypium barbadense]|nr:hypothetical protein GOBAR_DD19773 [Gossypium barbadense]
MKPYVKCYAGNYRLDVPTWPEKPRLCNVQERCGKENQKSNRKEMNKKMRKNDSTSSQDDMEIMYTLAHLTRGGVVLKGLGEQLRRVLRCTAIKSKGKQPLIEESNSDSK